MSDEQEKKNRRIALATSIGVHGVLLLLLFFIAAWRAPNPPLPEYGIELNFGVDQQGSGAVQPEVPSGAEQTEEKETPPVEEETSEIDQAEETEENITEPVKTTETHQSEVVSKIESPVVTEEQEDKTVAKPAEKPIDKVTETKTDVKPKEETPKAVYKPKTGEVAKEKQGTQLSQGDDANKTGDKGDPQGTLDARALYGKHGGGGGGVSMSGFNGFEWPKVEAPVLPDEAYGVYEFIVKVDDQGDVISVTALQRGLSLEAERRLKTAIEKLQFMPKGTNLPPQSEGKITFKVVSSKD